MGCRGCSTSRGPDIRPSAIATTNREQSVIFTRTLWRFLFSPSTLAMMGGITLSRNGATVTMTGHLMRFTPPRNSNVGG